MQFEIRMKKLGRGRSALFAHFELISYYRAIICLSSVLSHSSATKIDIFLLKFCTYTMQ